jgi:hypothetical protein
MFVLTLEGALRRLKRGETVTWRPMGPSMRPTISNFDSVRLIPVSGASLEVGDIVLAEVDGRHYLHRIVELDADRRRALIRSDDGVVNGWAEFAGVAGVCTHVRGRRLPRES